MGKNEKTPITIEGVEYQYEDLSQEQQVLFNHCIDLDRKISSAQFNLDQLNVGKNAFFTLLKNSLVAAKAIAEAEAAAQAEVAPAEATVQ
jgi:hypothetical protein